MPEKLAGEQNDPGLHVNFFKPRTGFMRREVTVILITLLAWAVVSIGFPIYLGISATDPAQPVSSGKSVFGMPIHYWFSSQFLILWFILICFIFNVLIDWLTKSYRKHR
jgi:putative solute:sodium symporter small subunit